METGPLAAFLKGEFESEEKAGFPRLSRVPDTYVRRFLHYYRSLTPTDTEPLKSALAKCACHLFAPEGCAMRLAEAESLAREQWRHALTWMGGDWQFWSLKDLKSAAGIIRSPSQHPVMKRQRQGLHMPEDVLAWIDGLTTCKAAELRKLVKQALEARFGFAAEPLGGGNWVYRRPGEESSFEVAIDYGSRFGAQLRYSVYLTKRRPGDFPSQLCFESIMGAGFGDWDFITEATADQDITLLADLVEHVVGIPARLAKMAPESTEGASW
jgi:hypothetical protein